MGEEGWQSPFTGEKKGDLTLPLRQQKLFQCAVVFCSGRWQRRHRRQLLWLAQVEDGFRGAQGLFTVRNRRRGQVNVGGPAAVAVSSTPCAR